MTDFIRMIKVSLNNMSNQDSDHSVQAAFDDLVNDYKKVTLPEYNPLLIEVYNKKDTNDTSNKQFRDLLFNLFILEYKGWYDIHPAVKELLLREKIING